MRPAVAVHSNVTDEALQTAAQYGIEDIVVYYGPGGGGSPDFQDYVALRRLLERYGLRLAAIEGGFSPSRQYHAVIFGGPKRAELIDHLLHQVREMAHAALAIWGYNWMATSWGRAQPTYSSRVALAPVCV